jgi:hypothetical protein
MCRETPCLRCTAPKSWCKLALRVRSDRFAVYARCPLLSQERPINCIALGDALSQKRTHALRMGTHSVGGGGPSYRAAVEPILRSGV